MKKELLSCILKDISDKDINYITSVINKFIYYTPIFKFEDIVTKNQNMKKLIQYAKKASNTDCNILLQGNSGTGKKVFAEAIHNYSKRAKGSFVTINCKDIPSEILETQLWGSDDVTFTEGVIKKYPGKFQLADEGTIFLKDIEYLSLGIQSKLLRTLEKIELMKAQNNNKDNINVRIICSSDNNILERVNNKDFRTDLYYKLNVINIKLMDLNERSEDISLLAKNFLEKLNNEKIEEKKSIENEAVEEFKKYKWQENVRELKNFMEKLYYICDESNITKKFLNEVIGYKPSINDNVNKSIYEIKRIEDLIPIRDLEKESIEKALEYCRGNVEKVSKILGLSRATIYRKINKYGIKLIREK